MKKYWIYIITSKKNGTLYIGVTNNLARRIYEHKQQKISGFTQKYNLSILVYAEQHATIIQAIKREKQVKHWNRNLKIALIEEKNPMWYDISDQLLEGML